ncbi:YniB family protein [Serratia marcescens]|uniref:YniB family protein n=1 Tax=Serratia marcescens TaxID=615 RepID=UPI000CCF4642|nr:YniB family protein [Serratia marcescens]PNU32122.1 hypothetical protein C2M07_08445 [Serratia marcescens]
MTYQQAGRIAILKRILGWVVFIPALLSTLISVLGFIYQHSEKTKGINAVMLDFVHVMVDMVRFNTPFLNLFWYNSPVPDVDKSLFSGANLMFIIIYILIFVVGHRARRPALDKLRVNQMILEQAKGSEGHTRQQLEERITLPHHTIFLQYFPLYILPIVIAVIAWFVIRLLGQLAGAA